MIVKIIEATNGFNWGKFLLARFDSEWSYRSPIGNLPLLRGRGWGPEHLIVFDLETGEGFILLPGGLASADLAKHDVWVCPMCEPFLEWLYRQDLRDLSKLPATVEVEAESALRGYRRSGLKFEQAFSPRLIKALEAYDIYTFRQLCSLTEKTFLGLMGKRKALVEEVQRVFKEHGFQFAAIKPR